MRPLVLKPLCWVVGLSICLAAGAFADTTYTFTLTNVTGTNLGGVYTSPYFGNITDSSGNPIGVGIAVICDDFATDSYLGQTFQVTATLVSFLNGQSTVKFDQGNATKQQQDYATAAYLVGEIVAQNQSTLQGAYQAELLSFALWALFDPSALNSLSAYDALQAQSDLTLAQTNSVGLQYSNVVVWTPSPQGVSQEFLTVYQPGTVPPGIMAEPTSPALLLVDVLGVAGLFLVVCRRVAASGGSGSRTVARLC